MNDTFYNTAFSELQRKIIAITTVENGAITTAYPSNPHVCDHTNDKIFLLSYKDTINVEYGLGGTETNSKYTTDYSRAVGVAVKRETNVGSWWLRSPDNVYEYAVVTRDNSGYVVSMNANSSFIGVVPVLRIQISQPG